MGPHMPRQCALPRKPTRKENHIMAMVYACLPLVGLQMQRTGWMTAIDPISQRIRPGLGTLLRTSG